VRVLDVVVWVSRTISAGPVRATLTALGIAIGIAAVSLLTSIGEGVRVYLMESFTQFGTHIVAVNPGKVTTQGMAGILSTVRPLTIDDAEALRRLPKVRYVVPVVTGTGRVEAAGRARGTDVIGVGHETDKAWGFDVSIGRFLPDDPPEASRPFCVLGAKLRRELFGDKKALGEFVRVGRDRFRVIGVMESKGQLLGFDLDDVLYVPASRALQIFNRESLMEIDVVYAPTESSTDIARQITRVLTQRHGAEDFTLMTQDDMLESLDDILNVVTFAVAALGSVSLFVGGVGVLTIMTTSLRERRAEIGLLRAVGATRPQVFQLFLVEAIFTGLLGGFGGLAILGAVVGTLRVTLPELPVSLNPLYVTLSLLLSVGIGVIAGITPALRASRLDPIEALREE
jgi:putative ABC transport system permease protein